MFTSRLAVGTAVTVALSALLLVSGCGNDENDDLCATDITGGSSPAPGTLTLTGDFHSDESVILSFLVNGVTKQVSGTPASDRTSFTLTGLPSGDVSVSITISCDAGRENNGTRTFTVK